MPLIPFSLFSLGPGALKPTVGDGIESRRPLVILSLFFFSSSPFAPILVCIIIIIIIIITCYILSNHAKPLREKELISIQ